LTAATTGFGQLPTARKQATLVSTSRSLCARSPPNWVTSMPAQKALPAPAQQKRQFEVSANDKRFLRSLRIAADETQEKEVE